MKAIIIHLLSGIIGALFTLAIILIYDDEVQTSEMIVGFSIGVVVSIGISLNLWLRKKIEIK